MANLHNFPNEELSRKELIESKLNLLDEFCLLDEYRKQFKAILSKCPTELAMEIKLHDLLVGNISREDFLRKEGF